jgi:hypothetical protein
MITFLLICIILLMFKPVRELVGLLFLLFVGAWIYASFNPKPIDAAPQPTAIVEPEPAPVVVPEPPKPLPLIGNGTGVDYGPAKPRKYIQQ